MIVMGQANQISQKAQKLARSQNEVIASVRNCALLPQMH